MSSIQSCEGSEFKIEFVRLVLIKRTQEQAEDLKFKIGKPSLCYLQKAKPGPQLILSWKTRMRLESLFLKG